VSTGAVNASASSRARLGARALAGVGGVDPEQRDPVRAAAGAHDERARALDALDPPAQGDRRAQPPEQAREARRARAREVDAVGAEPARAPAAVARPVEHGDPVGVAPAGVADDARVARLAAARLARRHEPEQPPGPDDPQRPLDVAAGHDPVRAERDDHDARQRPACPPRAQHVEALAHLAAAPRVDLEARAHELVDRAEHHRVAERERRARARGRAGALVRVARAGGRGRGRERGERGGDERGRAPRRSCASPGHRRRPRVPRGPVGANRPGRL
jgi:hypothetical protein